MLVAFWTIYGLAVLSSRNDSNEAKRKHWVPKKALGAQGSTGCPRKHWVLHWEKKKALNAFEKMQWSEKQN